MKPSRKQIERAAEAIKFIVPLNGHDPNMGGPWGGWTEKGLRVTKWPKGFTPIERKLIRAIAKIALQAGEK